MKHVRVDDVGSEVLDGACQGLVHLVGKRRLRVIGEPVVLPLSVRELGLQEQLFARDDPRGRGLRDGLPDAGLVVVLGPVDASKSNTRE